MPDPCILKTHYINAMYIPLIQQVNARFHPHTDIWILKWLKYRAIRYFLSQLSILTRPYWTSVWHKNYMESLTLWCISEMTRSAIFPLLLIFESVWVCLSCCSGLNLKLCALNFLQSTFVNLRAEFSTSQNLTKYRAFLTCSKTEAHPLHLLLWLSSLLLARDKSCRIA